jgi:signal transduction histidine kinase
MRRALTGLRGRTLLALVVTSLATLAVATLVLVPPLERRLETERRNELRGLARTIRPALGDIPRAARRAGSPQLGRIVDRLQRRTGGRIVVYGRGNTELADTAAGATGAAPRVPELSRERARLAGETSGVLSGQRDGVAYALTAAGEDEERVTVVIAKRLDDSRAAAAVVRAALPLALVAGLGVALLLAALLSHSLLRRLAQLRADAEGLGREGLDHPVLVSGRDEVSVVARALEEMRARLVDEQRSRQEFVSTASHELRTPLASLLATLELLEEEMGRGGADPRQSAARAQTALRQTHRLVALATDLLDVSRVDGGAPLALEPLEVGEVAETIAGEFVSRLAGAGRELRLEGGPALAHADPAAVARILRVLLDNAVKYGEGEVSVTIDRRDVAVLLVVEDEGPGLAPEEADRVFRRFARGASAGAANGSGLGLAIARGLAEAMGGTLEAQPGPAGTRFVVELRSAGDAPAEDHRVRTPGSSAV